MRVMRFQAMAPSSPARITFSSIISIRTRPFVIVLATAVPNQKAAMKLKKAAQRTARKGVRTRVETTVAMELAASCQPFENSKARVRKMTTERREKLVIAHALKYAKAKRDSSLRRTGRSAKSALRSE